MEATEVIVRATALGWESQDFPGWLEVRLLDAHGTAHRLVEKEPVLLREPLPSDVTFPRDLWLTARFVEASGDVVRVSLAYDVETTTGLNELEILAGDVRWL